MRKKGTREVFYLLDALARNWWLFIVRGVLVILFGITAWAWPDLTVDVLVILFGAFALVDGIFAIVAGIARHDVNHRWWAEVLAGVAGVVLGILTFFWPDVTALALLYLIAAWAVVTGVFQVVAAIQLRREINTEWLLGLTGVLSVLLGILLFIFPGEGAISLIWLIGSYAIVSGIVLIIFGFRARTFRDEVRELRQDLTGPRQQPLA